MSYLDDAGLLMDIASRQKEHPDAMPMDAMGRFEKSSRVSQELQERYEFRWKG